MHQIHIVICHFLSFSSSNSIMMLIYSQSLFSNIQRLFNKLFITLTEVTLIIISQKTQIGSTVDHILSKFSYLPLTCNSTRKVSSPIGVTIISIWEEIVRLTRKRNFFFLIQCGQIISWCGIFYSKIIKLFFRIFVYIVN